MQKRVKRLPNESPDEYYKRMAKIVGIVIEPPPGQRRKCILCRKIVYTDDRRFRYCGDCLENNRVRIVSRSRGQQRRLFKSRVASRVYEDFSSDEWLNKLKQTNGVCSGYNRLPHFVGIEKLTLDHIIPVSKAPDNFVYKINDVQPLCLCCNIQKSNKVG